MSHLPPKNWLPESKISKKLATWEQKAPKKPVCLRRKNTKKTCLPESKKLQKKKVAWEQKNKKNPGYLRRKNSKNLVTWEHKTQKNWLLESKKLWLLESKKVQKTVCLRAKNSKKTGYLRVKKTHKHIHKCLVLPSGLALEYFSLCQLHTEQFPGSLEITQGTPTLPGSVGQEWLLFAIPSQSSPVLKGPRA